MELGEHGFLRDHQNALASTALDQLGGQNTGFEGFSQTNRVGNQDTGAGLLESLQGRVELVGHHIHHATVSQVDSRVIGYCAPALALQIKHGGVVFGAFVRHQQGLSRIEDFDVFFEGGEKQGRLAPNQLRDAIAG